MTQSQKMPKMGNNGNKNNLKRKQQLTEGERRHGSKKNGHQGGGRNNKTQTTKSHRCIFSQTTGTCLPHARYPRHRVVRQKQRADPNGRNS
jgi:hypothetical protein